MKYLIFLLAIFIGCECVPDHADIKAALAERDRAITVCLYELDLKKEKIEKLEGKKK